MISASEAVISQGTSQSQYMWLGEFKETDTPPRGRSREIEDQHLSRKGCSSYILNIHHIELTRLITLSAEDDIWQQEFLS